MNDPWKDIRRAFPDECSQRDAILDFVRGHPGCRSSEIRAFLGCGGAGLFRVLFQLHRDGELISERGCLRVPASLLLSEGAILTEPTATHGLEGSA